MTPQEIHEWSTMLGNTRAERLTVIADLLRHANEDKMTVEDRRICRAEADRLRREMAIQRVVPNWRPEAVHA